MNSAKDHQESLLHAAESGDDDALGELIEAFRGILSDDARQSLMGVQARVDASDVVQLTWLSVFRGFPNFHGDLGAFAAWLKKIHERNIQDAVRNQHAARRDVSRELSGSGVHGNVTARNSSPSQHVMRGERNAELQDALDKLPPAQREAVKMRYFDGMGVAEITSRMGRSETAVAGLLKRGLIRLRIIMNDQSQ